MPYTQELLGDIDLFDFLNLSVNNKSDMNDAIRFKNKIVFELINKDWANGPEFLTNTRSEKDVILRFSMYFFLKKFFGLSSYKIASILNKDHASILNGLSKYSNWIEDPRVLASHVKIAYFKSAYVFFIAFSVKYFEN